MTEITPDCPELMEFMKWFKEQAWPEYKKLYTHASTCPKCQQAFIDWKGQMELKMLQTSDEELLKAMKEL